MIPESKLVNTQLNTTVKMLRHALITDQLLQKLVLL